MNPESSGYEPDALTVMLTALKRWAGGFPAYKMINRLDTSGLKPLTGLSGASTKLSGM